jgi:ankyrin repeat protein
MEHQPEEPEEQEQPAAAHPLMSEAFEKALRDGDVGEMRRLLDGGESVNCVHQHGTTPIMLALFRRELAIIQLLAERGADLSMVDNVNWSLLHIAALGGGRECIEWVLDNTTIDVNSTSHLGETPLMMSLDSNELEAAKLLVENGANLFLKKIMVYVSSMSMSRMILMKLF